MGQKGKKEGMGGEEEKRLSHRDEDDTIALRPAPVKPLPLLYLVFFPSGITGS